MGEPTMRGELLITNLMNPEMILFVVAVLLVVQCWCTLRLTVLSRCAASQPEILVMLYTC